MTNVNELHKKWSLDAEYRAAYQSAANEFAVADAVLSARQSAGLTQKQLAERMQATQSVIARLESGAPNTTIKTLQRVAVATGTHLKISFV